MILLPAILLYALLFWVLTWRRPWLALLSIFALAPFQHDLSMGGPFRFSIAEVNLLLTLPVFAAERRPVRLGPLAAPIAAYLLLCLFSALLHWRSSAPVSLLQTAVYLVAAVAVFRSMPRQVSDYRPALSALVAICCILSAFVLFQRSGYILGLHKNGAGASLACGMIVCAELWFAERDSLRRQLLLVALLLIGAGLFFTLSRGAWITGAAGLGILLILRRRFHLLLRAGAILALLCVFCWGRLPGEARSYAIGMERDRYNIQTRFESIDYALAQFQQAPLTGVGIGLRKEYDATNVFLLTLAETGIPGLAAFAAIHIAFLSMIWRCRRHLRPGSPEASLAAIGAALLIGKALHGAVDLYWGRGDLMIAWAAAGMTIRACSSALHKYPRNDFPARPQELHTPSKP